MKQMVRVLLLGVCGYGSNYIKEISERDTPGVRIEGICEVVPNVADLYPIIREQNIPIYKSPEEFYREHQADLAVVSTPIHLHYQQIVTCLQNGSNVLTEKPVCTSVQGARKLEELERQTGKFISVGYQLNYSRDVLALKQDILSGKFGKPVSMKALHAMRRGDKYYARNGWAGRIAVNNCAVNDSPFNNACAHQFQIMTFLLGDRMDRAMELARVEAEPYKANRHVENFDAIAIHAETVNRVPVWYFTAHALQEKKLGPVAEYRFEKGTVYFGRDYGSGPKAEYVYEGDDGTVTDYGKIAKGERLQKFYDAIQAVRTGSRPVCTVQCAIPHLEAVEQIARIPIVQVPEPWMQDLHEEDDTFHTIKDLQKTFTWCYTHQEMPSSVGFLDEK
ncbi:Gfo/Idh/MocA family protein [Gemmiger sp.]|uniref:Gfo/Idh/MocA family protein n=1 Tax=Gemmiger sp. TaxID=2049027 RepID=UPI003F0FF111